VRDEEDFEGVRKERNSIQTKLYSLLKTQDVSRRGKEEGKQGTVEVNKGRGTISAGGVGGVMPRVPPGQQTVEGWCPVYSTGVAYAVGRGKSIKRMQLSFISPYDNFYIR